MGKQELRVKLKSVRNSISTEKWEEISESIQLRMIKVLKEKNPDSVMIYLQSSRNREVGTAEIISYCLSRKISVAVPVTDEHGGMFAAAYDETTTLHITKWGIYEPKKPIPVSELSINLAIVPLLGCDHSGGRIGYGMGYYDRFLEKYPHIFTVGLCPEVALIDYVPVEEHDVALNYIVTEDQTLRIS
jgi:5-formyltetrahydrofolate cyclo-ligase